MSTSIEKVTYLKEGVTGKQLRTQLLDDNRANKEELRSISFNIKQLKKNGTFLKLAKITQAELIPANLLPFQTEAEYNRNGMTFYQLENLAVRYAKAKVAGQASEIIKAYSVLVTAQKEKEAKRIAKEEAKSQAA